MKNPIQLLNEIKIIDIERYCQFWNIHSFDWQISQSEIVDKLRPMIDQLSFGENQGNAIAIKDETQGELEITVEQLIYDVYAFTCLDDDIWRLISIDDFLAFTKSRFSILRSQGWSIRFDSNYIYPQISNLFCDEFVSTNFCDKILFIKFGKSGNACLRGYDLDSMWIHEIFFQEILRVYFMNSIVTFYKKTLEKYGVTVLPVNWSWALNNPLYPLEAVTTNKIKEREKYLIGNLRNRTNEERAFLYKIYGDSDICFDEMFDIPEKIMITRGMLRHIDKRGKYINVMAGRRITSDNPAKFANTIFMFGGCVFFGYAEEDQYTVPSCLQRILNYKYGNKYRVVNMATWGGNIDEEHMWLRSLRYKAGDIIFISYAGLIPLGDLYLESDISREFALRDNRIKYFNTLVHCNRYGYQAIAENIFETYRNVFEANQSGDVYVDVFDYSSDDLSIVNGFEEYYEEVINQLPKDVSEYGAIVMNCNPFTYGHRFLIEEASKREDHVIVFVVEEDRSEFTFSDRIELVRKGVEDLRNVSVVRSGSLMISSKTFPEYFTKKENNSLDVDPSEDIYLFSRVIAPRFNICRRYVGEEKKDLTTRKYNEVMKEILPTYGIELVEIPRQTINDKVISASDVRAKIETQEWNEIKRIVPNTTYEYLRKRYSR